MKTLIKIATQKTNLPILNTILVKNGFATGTDKDVCITYKTYKTDISNGLYLAKNFDKFQIPETKLKPEHFPDFIDQGAALSTVTLPYDILEYVSQGMSTEETRYYLCGIFFDKNCLVSTNGHILLKHNFDTGLEKGKILPAFAVKLMLSIMKEEKQKEGILVFMEKGFVFSCGRYSLQSKEIDAQYPDYPRVIPSKDKAHSFPFNSEVFAPVLKEAKAFAKTIDQLPHVKLEDNKVTISKNELVKSWEVSFPLPFPVGFNIDYLVKMPSGTYYQENSKSFALIEDGNKLAVIVPLRL